MDSKRLIQMIDTEVSLLREQIERAEFQSEYSYCRNSCIKIRKDLNELYKSLARFNEEHYMP